MAGGRETGEFGMNSDAALDVSGGRGRSARRWKVRLAILAVVAAGIVASVILWLHPFLSVNAPVPARVLVIEGWVPDYALEQAIAEYRRGSYERIYTTGGPRDRGATLSEYRSYAELAAASLARMGFPREAVIAVPSTVSHRNRTFSAAVALREYCREHGEKLDALNLVTVGAHARRSRLCFRRALGASVSVGVIAVEDQDYDPRRWWAFSEGLKTAMGEPIGLVYAWLAVDYGD